MVERRMFGSVGFMVGDVLRVGVGRRRDHMMMGRIAPADEAEALRAHGVRPPVMAVRTRRGWLFPGDDAVDSDEPLARWVPSALAVEA